MTFYKNKLISIREELRFPVFPANPATIRLALLQQFQQSEWWPAEMLEQMQFQQINLLLQHALKTVPFYSDWLRKSGWDGVEKLGSEEFRKLPILKRSMVNEAGDRLHSNRIPEGHGQVTKSRTSGSTGNPVTVLKTGWARMIWDVGTLRDHCWQRRDFSTNVAYIKHLKGYAMAPHGETLENWGPPVSSIYSTGQAHVLNIQSNVSEQLQWLHRCNPSYILTFPSNIEAIARMSRERGIELSNLREVRTLGETLTAETRQIVREIWDIPVTDCYSSQEIGYLALQAPDAEHYLVQSESVYVEILDEDNRPCNEGEIGRVIVTPLQNFATPLIRYELDDYAEFGGASSCGRGLPVLNRIMGRSRNMLVLPDGDRRFASIGIKNFNKKYDDRIVRYQVIQKTTELLEVRLVMKSSYNNEEEAQLRKHIQQHVEYPFNINIEYVNDIPRSAAGKYEDFRCEIPDM